MFYKFPNVTLTMTYLFGTVWDRSLAGIAQSVEQRTENPCVTSSNLVPGKKNDLSHWSKPCTIGKNVFRDNFCM